MLSPLVCPPRFSLHYNVHFHPPRVLSYLRSDDEQDSGDVAGDANAGRTTYEGLPIKLSEVALGPSHKIIQGDWPWHANRPTKEIRTRWHKPESPERLFSTLLADGHADLIDFLKDKVDEDYNGHWQYDYNPSNPYW